MSSWLSLSLPNPFKSPDDHSPPRSPPSPAADLSVLTQSITRQLRGVASFLAPPPNPHSDEPPSPSSSKTLTGIKNDLAEIGDSFKTGFSLLSNNKAVTKISKLASNLLQFENQQDGDDDDDEEEEYEDAVGITDEVINFVGEISLRPELWTDFPLSLNKDFGMSDVQKDHTLAIEHLVPSLMALRHKIDGYLNKEKFWIIYFVLLLPRLNENDSKLLTTPEIVEVRETLLQKLKSKHNTPVEVSSSKLTSDHLNAPERTVLEDVENSEPSSSEEEDVNTRRSKRTENEDDISFSDLENEGNSPSESNDVFSQSGSSEWVQLKEKSGIAERKKWRSSVQEKDSESEGSNDWLTVDKTDSDYD